MRFYIKRASSEYAAEKGPIQGATTVEADGRELQVVDLASLDDLLEMIEREGQPVIVYGPLDQMPSVNREAANLPPPDLPSITVYDDYVE